MTATSRRLLYSRADLIQKLFTLKGAKGVSFVSITDPDWIKFKRNAKTEDGKKIPNPYIGKVIKIARVLAQVNFSYENAVVNANKREIAKELAEQGLPPLDDAELTRAADERYERGTSWMLPLRNGSLLTPFCINKKDAPSLPEKGLDGTPLYLWVRTLKCHACTFLNIETGEYVGRDELADFMSEKDENAGENQGISDPNKRVVPRAYGFAGIAEIKTNQETWVNEEWYNVNGSIRKHIEVVAGTLEIPEE